MEDSWLDPDGNIIEVGRFKHNEYATDILVKEMGRDFLRAYMDEHDLRYPYEVLHERGWVRIKLYSENPKISMLGNCMDLTKPMRNTIEPAMNRKQLSVAKKLCDRFDTDLITAVNDRVYWKS